MKVNYTKRMLNRCPPIFTNTAEFNTLITSQGKEVTKIHDELDVMLDNTILSTANEQQISRWEKWLKITPFPQNDDDYDVWLQDRRETIMARLYQIPKLNSTHISNIVNIFTGNTAESYFKNDTVYVLINAPSENKQYNFENVERELKQKFPAHLKVKISRRYYTWEQIRAGRTWQDVKNDYETWQDVYFLIPKA